MIVIIILVVTLLAVLATYLVYNHIKTNMAIYRHDWKIQLRQIPISAGRRVFSPTAMQNTRQLTGGLGYVRRKSTQISVADSVGRFNAAIMTSTQPCHLFAVRQKANRYRLDHLNAYHKDTAVTVWPTSVACGYDFSFRTQKLMLWMVDSVIHCNVTRFYGISEDAVRMSLVSEYCCKGTLRLASVIVPVM